MEWSLPNIESNIDCHPTPSFLISNPYSPNVKMYEQSNHLPILISNVMLKLNKHVISRDSVALCK